MPVFHTKTIESILEPVAQQVSRLVILHEEAEDGNAMPDLSRPVLAVSKAVTNLVKVGRETINSSDDQALRQDMPSALQRVEKASKLLEEASTLLSSDPYSQPARKKLIDGARGILSGTSQLLMCFDQSEVQKIIRECQKVLQYLQVAEVIENMGDLVKFVKDLSPCLTKVSREVDAREKELTIQVHREILIRCLDSIKTLAPIFICSMKIFIQIYSQGGKGLEAAAENRNYMTQRMTDEINEIIRVLPLTTYDEDEWDADNLTVMKKAQNAIDGKLQASHDWLEDPIAVTGGIGEKSLRQILEYAQRIAERSLPPNNDSIKKMCGDIKSMTDGLCELRQDGKGTSPQAQALSRGIGQKLKELNGLIQQAVINVERSGIQQPAHTIGGRIEQAEQWLANPTYNDRGFGQHAIQLIVDEGHKLAESCPTQRGELHYMCSEIESLTRQLAEMCRGKQGITPQTEATARKLFIKLHDLKNHIQQALVNRVVEDFIDITSPLKHFTEAVLAPEGTINREINFQDKAKALNQFSQLTSCTARNVATGGSANKRLAEALLASANHVESLTPQLINAGSIRMSYPENKAVDEHFENLRKQYAESIQTMRNLADEATDTCSFIKASEDCIRQHTDACEGSIVRLQPQHMVDNTSSIARLANRVLMVAKQESDNSEDPLFVGRVNQAADQLQSTVTPLVHDAKAVALNMMDQVAISRWRQSNKAVITAVGQVRYAVMTTPEEQPPAIPPPPDMSSLYINIEDTDAKKKLSPLPAHYHFFSNKVSPTVRQQPSPSHSPIPSPHTPSHSPRPLSPLPKWARGNTSDLLYQEMYRDQKEDIYPLASEEKEPPPRPPLPEDDIPPPRPPPPEMDDEFEAKFPTLQPNQPIMMAAHGLHQEVRQWSSRDNKIIEAAKKMALLTANLSNLVRGEGGTKKDLIACAKAIAEASDEVTRLAKELARMCTDKRMRTNILQVCERIPTIGTQLRILSTVKATMLGAQGTDEDQEATDMLVGNAQNLMQSVKETVRACEAASIKIRTDSGLTVRWVRKQPWYQY
ncbi:vinculin-like isoform X3 [Centruroides vittatus]|uniref:vinculin-like isoform X3 n=1 Tax=Centruroides vittatus TaxID=120091 RepID=UPI00350F5CEA